IVGYIDDNQNLIGKLVDNIPVLGNSKYLFSELDKKIAVFVPIGDNKVRVEFLEKLKKNKFLIPYFIHKSSNIHQSVILGEGVYILPTTSIMPFTTIGDYTMISMGVNIAHHITIERGCFFSQGCNIGASVYLKEQAYCGIASTIMTGVEV